MMPCTCPKKICRHPGARNCRKRNDVLDRVDKTQNNITTYSLAFVLDTTLESVVLIRKIRPNWQHGLLNGVGGHVEEGETPLECVCREFYEEANVIVDKYSWIPFCTLHFPEAEVYMYTVAHDDIHDAAMTMTDEPIGRYRIENLKNEETIDNIIPLIELAKHAIRFS